MSDDGARRDVGRRDVLRTTAGLGLGAVGGIGAYGIAGTDPVSAAALADRPIPSLPGMESFESGRVHETEGSPRTLLDVDVLRGVQMTNFRIVSAEDAVEPPCDGGDALEYRFAAYGVAHALHREAPEDGEAEPADGGHEFFGASDSNPRVSVEVPETPCGAATLRAHTSAVETIDDPTAVFEAYAPSTAPETTSEASRDLEERGLLDHSEYVGPAVGLAEGGIWAGGRAARRVTESTNLPGASQRAKDAWSRGAAWLDRGLLAADILRTVRDGYDTSSVSTFDANSIVVTDDGGVGVRWLADFSIRVPAGGPAVDVDVEQWAALGGGTVAGDLNLLPGAVTDGIGFTITIPSNSADVVLTDVDLPEIATHDARGDVNASPTLATDATSPVTGSSSFEIDGDQYGLGVEAVDVGEREWVLDGGTSDDDVLEYEFDRDGSHTVAAHLQPDEAQWGDHADAQTRHRLTFDVGQDSHLRPAVEFDVDAETPAVGTPVTAQVTSASAPLHSVEGFEWSVTSHAAGVFPTSDAPEQCLSIESSTSGDSVTFTPECAGLYRIECTVDDGVRTRTVARDVPVRRETVAAFDVTPAEPVVGDTVSLDGSPAKARGGDVSEFDWSVTFYPDDVDTATNHHDDTGVETSFDAVAAGDYEVVLSVVDETAGQDTYSRTVEVDPTCGGGDVADATTVDGQTVCDVNGDGLYRDVTGDGSVTNSDVNAFFENQHTPAWDRPDLFDFDGNGAVGQGDVQALFDYVS